MRPSIALAALLILPACTTTDTSYPSLLPRPIEGRDDAEPVRPTPVVTPDAELDRQLATQRALAEAAGKRFQATAIEAEARSVALGSDSWIAAQAALAELAPIRGDTVGVVMALEELAIARGTAGQPAYPALDAAIAEIGAQAAAQAARIQALEDALGG